MVKITNISGRPLSRRTPRGNVIRWMEGFTIEVTSKRLLAEFDASNGFARQEEIGKKTGGGGLRLTSDLLSVGADLLSPKPKPKKK